MKNFTNLIIIDASGSMENKKAQVIGGLKQFFKDIKSDASSEVNTTTIVVDFSASNDFRVLVNSNNPSLLTDKLAASYEPRGWTALYDAIGNAFKLVPKKQDGVFVTILTDGQSNADKEFKASDVKAIVEKKRKKKWGITFMGTTEDMLKDAENIGISKGNLFQFTDTSLGMASAMKMSSVSRGIYYNTATSSASLNNVDVDNLVANQ